MSSKLKIVFWTILVLTTMNVSSVFAYSSSSYTGIKSTSDFDITYFLENSAFYNLMGSSQLQSVIENSDVQTFQNLCNSKNYKYITIMGRTGKISNSSSAYEFKGYNFVLSNEPIYKSTRTANGFTYLNTNGAVVHLYILKNGNVSLNTNLNNDTTLTWDNYGDVSYAYFFSTIGILNQYKDGILNYYGVNFEPYKEVYNTKTILKGYSPLPYFTFNTDVLDGKLTIENGIQFDFVPFEKLAQNKFVLGRIYAESWNDIGLVQIQKRNEDWTIDWHDYYIDLYRKDTIVGGKLTGYLKPIFDSSGNYIYSDVYVPSYFIENQKFYNIGLYDKNLEFTNQTDYFYISERDENGDIIYSGTIGSGDSNNSIENSIEQATNNIISGLLNGIIGLFIPTNEQMSEWLSRTESEVSDKMGILR